MVTSGKWMCGSSYIDNFSGLVSTRASDGVRFFVIIPNGEHFHDPASLSLAPEMRRENFTKN
jgi:hypothetical protein